MGTLELLRVFTEPQRLRILALLKKSSLSVNELKEILNFSQSNISHHLKILKDLTLIEYTRLGNQKYYQCSLSENLPEHIRKIADDIENLIKEIPESKEDDRNLIATLNRRKTENSEALFTSWRKLQPDLPYTAEFALEGLPLAGIALDIGCGTGEFIEFIQKHYQKIIGIDLSQTHLERARDLIGATPNVALIRADSHALPLRDSLADCAYLRMTLRFMSRPGQALSEIGSKVKPGGRISIVDLEPTDTKLYTRDFFLKFCEENGSYRLLSYKTYPKVFLASIEKTA